MDPLWSVRPDVGLGGGISHRVVADPGRQVYVEGAGINDAICIHQTLFSQLQNGKNRGHSERAVGKNTLLLGDQSFVPTLPTSSRIPMA